MKKILISTTLALALLSLGACSKKSDSKAKASSSVSSTAICSSSSTSSSKKVENNQENISSSFQMTVEATQKNMETTKASFKDTYSDIKVTAEAPETIVYTYIYKNKVTPTVSKEEMINQLALGTAAEFNRFTSIYPNFKERYIYLNPDNSEIFNLLITQNDIDAASSSSDSE
ncbi:hypothetical protein [Lactococcus cremoris]|uniref:hypothetical protein n=1 Tax=Lactococcus lactis subsp. cremoris TaxID=1359 RepID=UPI00038AC593|nr:MULTISPECIES: hypothetical protein [Lactococcus]EQC86144.1 hypothetical protein LLT1_12735 [Lactococcus cremoris subsp. cremoris TIFN1]AXN66003.1 hypothetical protein L3107_1810 [Lactococcus cremoris]KZK39911.1 hypothetical protein B40_2478 [Lactococcus cremoris]MRM51469.1 hypothetical protein [Lactococcus cremoris]OAJ97068.1 hypothetical protein A7U61_11045 [Lactococcus lactis]